MKVSEYLPYYGLLFNSQYQTAIDGKPISLNELFEHFPDYELTDIHIEQFKYFDLESLQEVLKDKYFTKANIEAYLRLLFDNYRESGGNPLEWLQVTFQSVNLNPENYRKDLISTIEKTLLRWIKTFSEIPVDYLYHFTNNIESRGDTEQEIVLQKYSAKHYVLAFIFECFANNIQLPIGNKKKLEEIGNERMGKGRGNRFYKVFNECINKDLNAENVLIQIGGVHWREAVKALCKEPDLVEAYLKSKNL